MKHAYDADGKLHISLPHLGPGPWEDWVEDAVAFGLKATDASAPLPPKDSYVSTLVGHSSPESVILMVMVVGSADHCRSSCLAVL